jgi:AraC-like DNA-binding protein
VNILERYGLREDDSPSLHPLIAVVGRRQVEEPLENAIAPHSMPFYQIIYVEEGEVNWWVDGRIFHLSQGDLILIKPYEIQCSLKGNIPVGKRFFIQLDLYESHSSEGLNEDERDMVNKLFSEYIPRVVRVQDDLHQAFMKILSAHRERDAFSSIIVKSQLLEMFHCLHKAQQKYLKKAHIGQSDAVKMLMKVDTYISENLSSTISIAALARIFSLSDVHFRRKFLAASGLSPHKYISNKKSNEARRLLSETDKTITEISQELAYSSSQHLSTSFSKVYSLSPREYRREVKNIQKQQPLSKVSDVSARIAAHFTRI